MSRIGRKSIQVPAGVDINLDNNNNAITVKGPKGTLSRTLHKDMKISVEANEITVERPSDNKLHRSLHGTTRSVIFNMVSGVTDGYAKTLELVGVGYRANITGEKVVLNVGYSHPVEVEPPDGIEFKTEMSVHPPYGNVPLIIISGIDKETVGQVAASIREIRKPEPYLGKGIQYVGEKIRRKAGKTAK